MANAACPKFDPTKPPLPPRLPGMIEFTPILGSCPDISSQTDPRCQYAISVLWKEFAAKSNTVSGGDRYYKARTDSLAGLQGEIAKVAMAFKKGPPWDFTKFSPQAVAAAMAFRKAAGVSKDHFRHYFGSGQEHAGMRMKDVLHTYAGKLVPQYGFIKVEVQPDPEERAADYVRRGGYLLWIDPASGIFGGPEHQGRIPVASSKPDWTPDEVKKFDLYIRYVPEKEQISYIIALRYESDFQRVLDAVGRTIAKAMEKACATATGDRLAQASAYAAAYPQALPYVAAWTVVAKACGRVMPKCPPPAGTPLVLQAVPTYPAGTIAWLDPKIGQYRIAVPIGLAGVSATHVEIKVVAQVPVGVVAVNRFEWERATRPLYARTWFIGTSAGVGVLSLATIIAVAARRRRAHAR